MIRWHYQSAVVVFVLTVPRVSGCGEVRGVGVYPVSPLLFAVFPGRVRGAGRAGGVLVPRAVLRLAVSALPLRGPLRTPRPLSRAARKRSRSRRRPRPPALDCMLITNTSV